MKTRCYLTHGKEIEQLNSCAELIKQGEVVAFPTETVYGLGANAFDEKAVAKIFKAKGRPSDNPLIVHISDRKILNTLVVEVPPKAKALMDAFWPGPLTIILNKLPIIPEVVTAGLDTVGIRFPSHPVAQAFLEACGLPVAAPSANLSGKPSPTTAQHVISDLNGRVPAIICADTSDYGLESTVIDLTCDPPVILRPGSVSPGMIEEVIGEVLLSKGLKDTGDIPRAPGMKYTHYSPKADLMIVRGSREEITRKIKSQMVAKAKGKEIVGILVTDETKKNYNGGVVLSLGDLKKPKQLSHNLFASLRNFDEAGVTVIYAEDIPNTDETIALLNRLYKAAGYHFL